MLETVTPVRYHLAVATGRTRPARIECEKSDGTLLEVVAKFSAGCDHREVGLSMEVVAACLAADLGLPVPQPYLLDMHPAFIATVPDAGQRTLMTASSRVAFGSTEAGNGFHIWSAADKITDDMLPLALGVFCLDAFIVNDDRRDTNPNLLARGRDVRIIDHESSFVHKMLLGWQPPWCLGGLAPLTTPGHHILYAHLKGRTLDLSPVEQAWAGISDARLVVYKNSVPHQWAAAAAVDDAVNLIRDVRDNITGALAEVRRILA